MADPFFGPAQIDVDEWRDTPLRHRYVHGGFEGTDTRFSFYFPPPERYEGRLLHFLEGALGGHERTATGPLGYSGGFNTLQLPFACGAYLAESNQGHFGLDYSGLHGDSSILHWRASAETARFSKQLAAEMYGEEPHHSYAFGGSGGALRSVHAIERAGDVFDGCVPFMHGHHFLMSDFAVAADALRLLGPKERASIIDATEVGGSGNPFDGLSSAQRVALADLYRSGFARGGELSLEFPLEVISVMCWLQSEMTFADPEYFEDFWSVPGYAGADDPTLAEQLYEKKTKVRRVVTTEELLTMSGGEAAAMGGGSGDPLPIGVVVKDADVSVLRGATMQLLSGKGAGRELAVSAVVGDVLVAVTGPYGFPQFFEGVVPGDEILLSNRKSLAQCFWSRHHLEGELEYRPAHQWAIDGRPIYPQRPHHAFMNMGPDYTYTFEGKMILVQNTLDIGCWPSGATVYHERAKANFGDRLDDHFRLWWNDKTSHVPASFLEMLAPPRPHPTTRLNDYLGSVHQAVFDLIDWVEHGKEPPVTSGYEYSADWKLTLAPSAAERGGIQPLVKATANGGVRADVKAGDPVQFEAIAEVPGATGRIISAEWDFEGEGTWPLKQNEIDGSSPTVRLTASHTFKKPGTYFPAIRVTSHRDGDVNATLCRVPNLGRVRVVVS